MRMSFTKTMSTNSILSLVILSVDIVEASVMEATLVNQWVAMIIVLNVSKCKKLIFALIFK